MQRHRNFATIVTLAALAIAGATSSASAQTAFSPRDTVSERVSYRDLNITQEAGARALVSRIRQAAKHVCGPYELDDMLDGGRGFSRCVNDAIQGAVDRLNSPLVASIANPDHNKSRIKLAAADR
jgi:UrcA family protein